MKLVLVPKLMGWFQSYPYNRLYRVRPKHREREREREREAIKIMEGLR